MSQTHQDTLALDAAERRQIDRKSLMLRSAKVVCHSGEYICLIRDVSELGTSLSFLHDAPPEPRIILALTNGLTFPIERIWAGKRQAGYRFASPVSLDEFLHENTPFALRPIRLNLEASARIIDGRFSHTARLLDLSCHGAKIECDGVIQKSRLIGFQAEGMTQQLGEIVWCDEASVPFRYGLQFQHPIELKSLAETALRLQPFGAPERDDLGKALGKASAA